MGGYYSIAPTKYEITTPPGYNKEPFQMHRQGTGVAEILEYMPVMTELLACWLTTGIMSTLLFIHAMNDRFLSSPRGIRDGYSSSLKEGIRLLLWD